jgi:hypothetical protein
MPETQTEKLEMSAKTAKVLAWVAWGLVLLGTLAGAVAAFAWVSAGWRQVASGVSVLALLSAAEIRRQLPSARAIKAGPVAGAGAVVLFIVLSVVALGACKLPPLALGYRSYAVAWKTRDAAGEALEVSQRAKFKACEAKYNPTVAGERVLLIACIKKAREPVLVWVKHIKPPVKISLAATWAVLEVIYVAGDKKIDKMSKVVKIACEKVRLAEVALKTYGDKLGEYKAMILGPVAGLKALVCP